MNYPTPTSSSSRASDPCPFAFRAQVAALEGAYVTDLHWLLGFSRRQQAGAESFAMGCTDGKFILMGRSGRVERSVEAHRGQAPFWAGAGRGEGGGGSVRKWEEEKSLPPRLRACQTFSPTLYAPNFCPCPHFSFILFAFALLLCLPSPAPHREPGACIALRWNHEGTALVTAGEDGAVKVKKLPQFLSRFVMAMRGRVCDVHIARCSTHRG